MHESIYYILSLDEPDFIRAAYTEYLKRDIDRDGESYYLGRMAIGFNKIDVLYDLSRSDEFLASKATQKILRNLFLRNGNAGIWPAQFFRKLANINSSIARLENTVSRVSRGKLAQAPAPEVSTSRALQPQVDSDGIKYAEDLNIRPTQPPWASPPLKGTPLVSIIIVNYNGAHHLPELGKAICAQTYKHFEIIFVDNNSHDDSLAVAQEVFEGTANHLIKCPENFGFAEGNNIGYEKSTGDLILLLNNDTTIPKDFLSSLVHEFLRDKDGNVGAVIPKIVFFKPFLTISIEASQPFTINREALVDQLGDYKKVISRTETTIPAKQHEFRIPAPIARIKIELTHAERTAFRLTNIQVNGQSLKPHSVNRRNLVTVLIIDLANFAGREIINNVGSYINENGDCGDIGIYEEDTGQYDTPRDVDALCGCAALVRREALGNFPLFSPDFFAYYEDTELSIRLRAGGWKIHYTPDAKVWHKHASTSNDKSARFKRLVARNRLLLLSIHFKHLVDLEVKKSIETWNHFISVNNPITFPDPAQQEFVDNLQSLISEIPPLIERGKRGLVFFRKNKFRKIGIYNEYWNTRGGGELRALRLAEALSEYLPVDLISSRPFDLDDLRNYFSLNLSGVRKVIVAEFSGDDTSQYDLFINSTHHSNLISRAKASAYLLSFPHQHVTTQALASYDVVLANSEFTASWARTYWGSQVALEILYPPIETRHLFPGSGHLPPQKKERLILSIGRFFPSGHSKKQLEMVRAFRKISRSQPASNWKLVLVGSLNEQDSGCVQYFRDVQDEAGDLNIDIFANHKHAAVIDLLKRSAIYWHFTGLDVPTDNPEAMEHFGMSVAEAMSFGCVPIAHRSGGLPEVLGDNFSGNLFSDLDQLITITQNHIAQFEDNDDEFSSLASEAKRQASAFDTAHHNQKSTAIIMRHFDLNLQSNSLNLIEIQAPQAKPPLP